jgi:hypothetical protein
MPVRDKAINHISSMLIGGLHPDAMGHISHREIRPEALDLLKLAVDAAYDDIVRHIDWNRVYLDATARHLSLHKGVEDDEPTTLVAPSQEKLDAAAEEEDERPGTYVPPPAWHAYRREEVCPECIMEAVLANEWGGKQADKWAANPISPPWRFEAGRPQHPELKAIVLELVAHGWKPPETAEPTELDHDGHMPTCYEKGRPSEAVMVCDPRCPHYDGWCEAVAEKLKIGAL